MNTRITTSQLCLALSIFTMCQMTTHGSETKVVPITEALLYETAIRDVDQRHGDAGVLAVLDTLKNRSLDGDRRALRRLFEIFFTSDGYVTEGVLAGIGAVYKAKPMLVLENASAYDPPKRDLIYKGIIFDVYYGLVFQGRYPSNIRELKALGKQAERFLQMYDYYLKQPKDIEDWSVNPPN